MEFSLLISQVLLYINNNPLFEKTGEHQREGKTKALSPIPRQRPSFFS